MAQAPARRVRLRSSRLAGWRNLGLRSRVTLTFALGALALSAAMAAITYWTARAYLLEQRQDTVTRQAFDDAAQIRTGLLVPGTSSVLDLLRPSNTAPGSSAVLNVRGRWYQYSVGVAVPPQTRDLVEHGSPAIQHFELGGVPQIVVGIPIPQVQAAYYEVFPLDDLARTLRVLALALAAAAAATTIAGALVGRWASGRALRPLAEVARAAAAISLGRLDTRLETADEADLAVLASSFNTMADRLQERIEREARFTSDVSHELRSPLTTLVTSVGVLQSRRSEMTERSRRALDLLSSEVHRFQRMVEDLLEISRYDAGRAELSLDEVEVGDLVRRAVAGAVPVKIADGVGSLRVQVDKRRIERVLANLVENADNYGGGVASLSVEAVNGKVRLVVEDHGPGIPPEEAGRIFERFYRGSAAGRRSSGEGAGLGLSLVAEHVHLHGGEVWLERCPAGGSRFVVELPANREAS
jgi:two-component system sensor histidine kinase MtrB